MSRRALVIGTALAVLGPAIVVVTDFYFARTDRYGGLNLDGSISPGLDLWMSLPLLILAALALSRAISLIAATAGFVVLAGWTVYVFASVMTSASSTAAIGFLVGPFYALVGVFVVWAIDAGVAAARRYVHDERRRAIDDPE